MNWVIPDFLPEGVVVLAGRPGVGKTCLALQAAVAVATGETFLEKLPSTGNVLYFAQTETQGEMEFRLIDLGQSQEVPGIDFRFVDDSSAAILADLQQVIGEVRPRLVVIDTLSRALGREEEEVVAAADVISFLGTLQRLADEFHCCVLVLDDSPRAHSSDVHDVVRGTSVIRGLAEGVLVLSREIDETSATLAISGRCVEGRELRIEFDEVVSCWNLPEVAQQNRYAENKIRVVARLSSLRRAATAEELTDKLQIDRNDVNRALEDLVGEGTLRCRIGETVRYELNGVELFSYLGLE